MIFGMRRLVHSAAPVVVEIRLILQHELIHADLHHVLSARALDRVLAVLDPPFESEVRRLGCVEAVVETRVVRVGKGNHEFAFVLDHLAVRNRFAGQHGRRDDRHFMTEERGTSTSQ